jgi:hypothetical protein
MGGNMNTNGSTVICDVCGGALRRKVAEDLPGCHDMVATCSRCHKEFEHWVEFHPYTDEWDQVAYDESGFPVAGIRHTAREDSGRGRQPGAVASANAA